MKEYKLEELDDFMDKLSKENIEIPEELNNRIDTKINELKPKKKYKRNILVSGLCFMIIFLGLIKFSDVGIYAAEISVLKPIVELIRGDKGIENAVQHGYKEIPGVTIEKDGYMLTLDDIYMDEDRISFTSIIEGDAVDKLEKESKNIEQNPINAEETLDIDPRIERVHVGFTFPDFEGYGTSMSHLQDKFLGRVVERTFRSIGEVEEFLTTNPKYLNIQIKVYKGKEVIQDFGIVKVPIKKEDIQLSKDYTLNKEYKFNKGTININKLTVSPTRMRLDLNLNMDDKYFITGFENPHLKDDIGKIYKPEGLISAGSGTENMVMYFVPSIYFQEIPEELYFCFDGIRIGTEEGREFRLYLDDEYPKTIEYMGERILIKEVKWQENGKLHVIFKAPEEEVLKIQNLGLINNDGYTEWSDYVETDQQGNDIKYTNTGFIVEKQEYYDFMLEAPGYLVPNKEEIKLRTK